MTNTQIFGLKMFPNINNCKMILVFNCPKLKYYYYHLDNNPKIASTIKYTLQEEKFDDTIMTKSAIKI